MVRNSMLIRDEMCEFTYICTLLESSRMLELSGMYKRRLSYQMSALKLDSKLHTN